MSEELQFNNEVTIEDLSTWHEAYGCDFPLRAGRLMKAPSDGLAVLGDRQ